MAAVQTNTAEAADKGVPAVALPIILQIGEAKSLQRGLPHRYRKLPEGGQNRLSNLLKNHFVSLRQCAQLAAAGPRVRFNLFDPRAMRSNMLQRHDQATNGAPVSAARAHLQQTIRTRLPLQHEAEPLPTQAALVDDEKTSITVTIPLFVFSW